MLRFFFLKNNCFNYLFILALFHDRELKISDNSYYFFFFEKVKLLKFSLENPAIYQSETVKLTQAKKRISRVWSNIYSPEYDMFFKDVHAFFNRMVQSYSPYIKNKLAPTTRHLLLSSASSRFSKRKEKNYRSI